MGKTFREYFDGLIETERSIRIDVRGYYDVMDSNELTLKQAAEEWWNLSPEETIAAVALGALGDEDQGPGLSQSSRDGSDLPLGEASVASLYPFAPRPERLALSAGLLQIFDFWNASHTAAQEADDLGETKVTAYWHGIAHRREPDPGNAAYWFRRVGRHPIFEPLAEAAQPILDKTPDLAARLIPQGVWDPFEFIEMCTRSRAHQAAIARRLQRIEMLLLLEASLPSL